MHDLISRKEAIDAHYEYCNKHPDAGFPVWSLKILEDLPSAQPEMNLDEWCTDCKEYDHEKHCCPRWNRVIRQTLNDMKEEQPEIVRCKDCIIHGICRFEQGLGLDGFCSQAERRTDGVDS